MKKIIKTKSGIKTEFVKHSYFVNSKILYWRDKFNKHAKVVPFTSTFNKSLCWGMLGRSDYRDGVHMLFTNYTGKSKSHLKFAELSVMFNGAKYKILVEFMNKGSRHISHAYSYDYVGDEDAYLKVYGIISIATQKQICINLLFAALKNVYSNEPYANTIDYFLDHYLAR